MPREIKLTCYLANELSAKTQRDVLNEYSEVNVDRAWYNPILQDFICEMEEYGVSAIPEFSGFWSQGDGACFVSETLDTDLLIRKLYNEGYDIPEDGILYSGDYSINIEKVNASYANRYSHENTVQAVVYLSDNNDRVDKTLCSQVEKVVTDWVHERSRNLFSQLEHYYIELTSDEAIMQTLVENGYLFTENGLQIPNQ